MDNLDQHLDQRHNQHSHNQNSHWYRLHPQPDKSDQTSTTLSADNRGLAYADGFFTTMAVIDGKIAWPDYHWQRLSNHAQTLQLNIPLDRLILNSKALAQHLKQGIVKIVVTRAPQALRGYAFSDDSTGRACEIWLKSIATTLINHTHIVLPNGHSIAVQAPIRAVCLSSQLACLPPTLAGLKSLNRLDSVLASSELERLKAKALDSPKQRLPVIGEGLVRDMSGSWVEGTMSNVFYQLTVPRSIPPSYSHITENYDSSRQPHLNTIDVNYLLSEQWYTPSMNQSGVAGVMRQVIIDNLSTTINPVSIRPLTDSDLPNLSKLFFCNAVRGIIPASGLTLPDGKSVRFM